MAKAGTYFAAFFLGMVLLKDGTLGTLVSDAGRFLGHAVSGIRPITRVG